MIRHKTYKGFLYFDGLNTFVLSYGVKYMEDNVKRCDLLGIHECTIKNFAIDFDKFDLALPWDIGTNIFRETELHKYFRILFGKNISLKGSVYQDDITELYLDFLGCILSGKLGVSHRLIEGLDNMIKLSRSDDKIIYNPVLISASYFTSYAQITSYFDR